MQNYKELIDEFSNEELIHAYKAITCSDLQEKLYEDESPLLVFLFDTRKQDLLYEFIGDLKEFNSEEPAEAEEPEDIVNYIDGC